MAHLKYLEDIYFNPSHPACFSGVEKLYQTVRNEGKFKIGRRRIKQFLQNQEEYSLQRDIKRKRKRRIIVVSGVDRQWGADLADVRSLEKSNNGIKYWLIVIDIFSKFLFVETLKDKKASTVLAAFKKILAQERRPDVLSSDKGGELNNSLLKNELKKRHIKYFTSQNEDIQNSIAERVIRTLRNKKYRLFQRQRSYRYVDVLPQLVESYNKTKHRSLGYLAPVDINRDNEAVVWDRMYNHTNQFKPDKLSRTKPTSKPKRPPAKQIFKFRIDDYVRLAYTRYTFQRDYQQKWTTELFKVSERFLKQNIPLYRVVDMLNDPIIGSWYQWELLKVDKNQEFWRVESIINRRKRKGKKEFLVKWQGYGNKVSSWVAASDIKDLSFKHNSK